MNKKIGVGAKSTENSQSSSQGFIHSSDTDSSFVSSDSAKTHKFGADDNRYRKVIKRYGTIKNKNFFEEIEAMIDDRDKEKRETNKNFVNQIFCDSPTKLKLEVSSDTSHGSQPDPKPYPKGNIMQVNVYLPPQGWQQLVAFSKERADDVAARYVKEYNLS